MAIDGRFKKVLPVLFGNILEAYDFCLYGLLAVYFSKVFFPESSNSLFFSFLLFSIAYIARPLGSILWGHIADKYGRKKVMIGTLSLMAVPATGMALMPSYESIGVSATVLVICLRFFQGVAIGGESPTIIVSLYEMAPENRKGLYGSLYDSCSLLGYLFAVIFMVILGEILGESNLQNYGWRILFGISLFFIFVIGYLRKRLIETSKGEYKNSFPFLETVKHGWGSIIEIVLYLSGGTAMLYNLLFHNYLVIYAKNHGVKTIIVQGLIVLTMIITMPIFGYISDKVDRLKLLKVSYLLTLFLAYPLYYLFLSNNLSLMFFGYFVFAILTSIVCSTFPSIIVPLVSSKCRVTSVGIAFSLSVIIGSFLPAFNELLKNLTANLFSPVITICFSVLISFVMLFVFKKKTTLVNANMR